MDKKKFFSVVRKEFGKLSSSQVEGMELVLAEAGKRHTLRNQLAYILATDWHETARTMQPIKEYGRGKGKKYGRKDKVTGKVYYGRGLVQLTWKFNYEKATKVIGADFVRDPDLALSPKHAIRIMFEGMESGWFTGKKLSHYITVKKSNYVGARRIINGTDRAHEIAEYAKRFEKALVKSGYGVTNISQKPLSKSRTINGGAASATGGTAIIVKEVVEVLQGQQEAFSSGDYIAMAFGVITVIGGLAAIYARWDDAGRPKFGDVF